MLVRSSWLIIAALIAFLLAPRIDAIAPGLGELRYLAGLAFAVLLYLSVLLHEVSHALMAKAFGFEVRSVTLHFLGGVTEIDGESDTAFREFWIAVVGPLTSIAIAAAAYGLTFLAPEGLLLFACEALAFANLAVGVLNLLPGLPLDGGRVFRALVWGVTRRPFLATQVAGWAGRLLAVVALGYPFALESIWGVDPTVFDYVIAVIIAFFLWGGATQSMMSAKVRQKLPALQARTLARRVVGVPEEVPLSEAVRRAQEAQAGGIVVLGRDGAPRSIVSEQAVLATPENRRPWMSAGSVARRLEPGLTLSADLAGENLVRAMHASPASEYVLLDAGGVLFGVLVSKDVDDAFAQH